MSKLRREIEFIERVMQRVRAKLDRFQQNPIQTPSTSIIGIRPDQPIEQHDYHETHQGRIQARNKNDMYIDPYPTREPQL